MLLGAVLARRLLDEALHPPVPVEGTTPNEDGSSTGVRWSVASAPCDRWKPDQLADVEVGEHVAVDDDEGVVDAGRPGGEGDGPAGVQRLGLDGVAQRHAGALPSG